MGRLIAIIIVKIFLLICLIKLDFMLEYMNVDKKYNVYYYLLVSLLNILVVLYICR
jgi:hypothetical protein